MTGDKELITAQALAESPGSLGGNHLEVHPGKENPLY